MLYDLLYCIAALISDYMQSMIDLFKWMGSKVTTELCHLSDVCMQIQLHSKAQFQGQVKIPLQTPIWHNLFGLSIDSVWFRIPFKLHNLIKNYLERWFRLIKDVPTIIFDVLCLRSLSSPAFQTVHNTIQLRPLKRLGFSPWDFLVMLSSPLSSICMFCIHFYAREWCKRSAADWSRGSSVCEVSSFNSYHQSFDTLIYLFHAPSCQQLAWLGTGPSGRELHYLSHLSSLPMLSSLHIEHCITICIIDTRQTIGLWKADREMLSPSYEPNQKSKMVSIA